VTINKKEQILTEWTIPSDPSCSGNKQNQQKGSGAAMEGSAAYLKVLRYKRQIGSGTSIEKRH
jgi:hypothetical protein